LPVMLDSLVQCRVPAGKVWPGTHTSQHPQLLARNFYEELGHPVVGTHSLVTTPFLSRHTQRWLDLPAPFLGQHNHRVLSDVLGYSDQKIQELEALEVIGTIPKGVHQ
jgi:crotonobetainyl-CoA:carnitine CoA-transferase CaiB-like acyl-CoA transferase